MLKVYVSGVCKCVGDSDFTTIYTIFFYFILLWLCRYCWCC